MTIVKATCLYSADFHFDGSSYNDSLYFSSDTDETFDEQIEAYFEDGGKSSFRQELASWVLKHKVEQNKADALSDLLCKHFPGENLPKSCRT